jgi:hypothetical protein
MRLRLALFVALAGAGMAAASAASASGGYDGYNAYDVCAVNVEGHAPATGEPAIAARDAKRDAWRAAILRCVDSLPADVRADLRAARAYTEVVAEDIATRSEGVVLDHAWSDVVDGDRDSQKTKKVRLGVRISRKALQRAMCKSLRADHAPRIALVVAERIGDAKEWSLSTTRMGRFGPTLARSFTDACVDVVDTGVPIETFAANGTFSPSDVDRIALHATAHQVLLATASVTKRGDAFDVRVQARLYNTSALQNDAVTEQTVTDVKASSAWDAVSTGDVVVERVRDELVQKLSLLWDGGHPQSNRVSLVVTGVHSASTGDAIDKQLRSLGVRAQHQFQHDGAVTFDARIDGGSAALALALEGMPLAPVGKFRVTQRTRGRVVATLDPPDAAGACVATVDGYAIDDGDLVHAERAARRDARRAAVLHCLEKHTAPELRGARAYSNVVASEVADAVKGIFADETWTPLVPLKRHGANMQKVTLTARMLPGVLGEAVCKALALNHDPRIAISIAEKIPSSAAARWSMSTATDGTTGPALARSFERACLRSVDAGVTVEQVSAQGDVAAEDIKRFRESAVSRHVVMGTATVTQRDPSDARFDVDITAKLLNTYSLELDAVATKSATGVVASSPAAAMTASAALLDELRDALLSVIARDWDGGTPSSPRIVFVVRDVSAPKLSQEVQRVVGKLTLGIRVKERVRKDSVATYDVELDGGAERLASFLDGAKVGAKHAIEIIEVSRGKVIAKLIAPPAQVPK